MNMYYTKTFRGISIIHGSGSEVYHGHTLSVTVTLESDELRETTVDESFDDARYNVFKYLEFSVVAEPDKIILPGSGTGPVLRLPDSSCRGIAKYVALEFEKFIASEFQSSPVDAIVHSVTVDDGCGVAVKYVVPHGLFAREL